MEKLRRADDSMGFHRYCSQCHRLFLSEDEGCNYCSNCGHKIVGWSETLKERYRKGQRMFVELYHIDKGALL